VHLGALGIVTAITLEVVLAFCVAQTVYRNLRMEVLLESFDEIVSSAYSVSLFTDWGSDGISQVWLKDRVGDVEPTASRGEFYGASPAVKDIHPVAGMSGENCTPQMGVPGPWHRRLPHFKLEHTPSVGDELQTEYFVSRADAPEAIRRVSALRDKIHPLVLISELRTIAADSLWLSPNYRRDSVGIHFTWKNDLSGVLAVLPAIEDALGDLKPTPHWAKISTMPAEIVRSRFPKLEDFGQLARKLDPDGRCHNDFLRRFVL
jgi:xylitol oxidase